MQAKVNEVKGKCHLVLVEATRQVCKRLPPSSEIFHGLSRLHPSQVLSQLNRVPLCKLPMQHLMANKLQEIDEQYREILFVNWGEEAVGIPNEAVAFWTVFLIMITL